MLSSNQKTDSSATSSEDQRQGYKKYHYFPKDIVKSFIKPFLSPKERVMTRRVSKVFNNAMDITPENAEFWRQSTRCDADEMKTFLAGYHSDTAEYKTLIRALHYIPSSTIFLLNSWDFYALSGSVDAMRKANFSGEMLGVFYTNVLEWAAFSNSIKAVRYAVSELKVTISTRALEYAIQGNAKETVWYLTEMLNINPVNIIANDDMNAMHVAAHYGQVKMMQLLHRHFKFPPDRRDRLGKNAFLIAAEFGHVECMKYAASIGDNIHATLSRNSKTENATTLSAEANDLDALQFTLSLQISPFPKNMTGYNAFIPAVLARRPDMILMLRQWCADHRIDPDFKKMSSERGNSLLSLVKGNKALLNALFTPLESLKKQASPAVSLTCTSLTTPSSASFTLFGGSQSSHASAAEPSLADGSLKRKRGAQSG